MRLQQENSSAAIQYVQDLAAPLPVVLQSQAGEVTTQYVYALSTRPIAQYLADTPEYLLPDALGSVRQIVDAAGNVTLAESYEPYGTVLTSTGTASSIFAYAGEQIDTSGLVFLRARYMNPTLGIFLARDPWSGNQMRPGAMNGFAYVEGNPINFNDPTGWCRGGDTACETVAQFIENTYHIGIDRGIADRDCDSFARRPGVSISWTTEELLILNDALDLTKSFLDNTSHSFDSSLGNRGYVIQRVYLTDQDGLALLTTNVPVKTQVPRSGVSGKSSTSSLMHEFFHAFDYFTRHWVWTGFPVAGHYEYESDNSVFSQDKPHFNGGDGYDPKYRLSPDVTLDPNSPIVACGSTAYACSNDRENFADNAAAYALDWLSHYSSGSQKSDADSALSNFPNGPVTRVENWTDLDSSNHSKRRVFFNNYFFGGESGGLGGH